MSRCKTAPQKTRLCVGVCSDPMLLKNASAGISMSQWKKMNDISDMVDQLSVPQLQLRPYGRPLRA